MRRNAGVNWERFMDRVVTAVYVFIFVAILFLVLLYGSSIGSRRVDNFRNETDTRSTIHANIFSVDIHNTVLYDGVTKGNGRLITDTDETDI